MLEPTTGGSDHQEASYPKGQNVANDSCDLQTGRSTSQMPSRSMTAWQLKA